jgi:hypothetical protein
MVDYLSAYRNELKKQFADTENVVRPMKEKNLRDAGGTNIVLCDVPLDEQVEALMRELPPAERCKPWSIEALSLRLRGKYRPNPNKSMLSGVLRRLGWTATRLWSDGYDGRRYWLHP